MRPSRLIVAITLGSLPLAAARSDEPDDPRSVAKKDLDKFQGTWVEVSRETRGVVVQSDGQQTAEYRGDAVVLKSGGDVTRPLAERKP